MMTIQKRYDDIVTAHQAEMIEAIDYMKQEMAQKDCMFGDKLVPTFLKPVFVSQEEVDEVMDVIRHIMNILHKVTLLYFSHPDLREYFYINDKAAEVLAHEHRYDRNVVISRPDAFYHKEALRFVEFNCDSPAGAGFCDIQEEIFCQTFPMKALNEKYTLGSKRRTEYLLEALLESYKQYAGPNKRPNIAIVDWKEVRTQNEFIIIQKIFREKGFETTIADPRELKYTNGRLEHKGFPINLIYRRAIFKELMEKVDQIQDFIRADQDGKVCVVNPLRSRLASTKAILAIITNQKDFRHLFTDEENQVIKKHIPWTRRVLDMQTHYENNQVFLKKHIIAHKDGLVLKPSDSYGGKDVTIGKETKQSEWDGLVDRILKRKEDWVVQKYVTITEMNVPQVKKNRVELVTKKYNINPYVYGGVYSGSMARLSDQSVINVSAGGGLVPVIKYQNNN